MFLDGSADLVDEQDGPGEAGETKLAFQPTRHDAPVFEFL
jgi:hypothetical protein